jgi:hypothetical protein
VPTALFAIALAALSLSGCVNGRGRDGPAGNVTIELSETAGSGQSGTAALIAEGQQALVVIKIDGNPVSESQPVHIHKGTCDELSADPAFGLQNVSNGRSHSTVDVSLETLTSGTYAIDLHPSDEEPATHTSCGNIKP